MASSISLDDVMNIAIPGLLLLIAAGFIYIKFLQPYFIPLWEKIKEKMDGEGKDRGGGKKELVFE